MLSALTAPLVLSPAMVLTSGGASSGGVFDDAVAVWHMRDGSDGSGNADLHAVGDVSLGVALEGEERSASIARGGDGYVARFDGGYLDAGHAGAVDVQGKALTLCLRARDPSGRWDSPLFSKHGGHAVLTYNLFSADLGEGTVVGFELGTDWSERPLRVSVPLARIDARDWHDFIVRYSGAKLEMFVDGVLVDEEWPMGSLRGGSTAPCLVGAEWHGGAAKAGFRGIVDHAALWNRALTDDEIVTLSGGAAHVALRDKQILGPERSHLQYWRPRQIGAAVGDCMPFWHDGRFHLFYLFDRRRHGSKWGLGAHQWAHVSTTDLIRWEHHPMAIPISEEWEGSICTGSVLFHEGTYYAFYATRLPDGKQHLSLATSADGVHFNKQGPAPLASPPEGYDPLHFRDPFALFDEAAGLFRLIVTARLTDGRDGCLAQLTSSDLTHWQMAEPLLVPGRVTDCPDVFEWNGWYYLLAEYCYWVSRSLEGPWIQPDPNRLDVLYVPKTAPFREDRRIYASWLPDQGWGGDLVFRELVQLPDGRLGTCFPDELIPPSHHAIPGRFTAAAGEPETGTNRLSLRRGKGFEAATCPVPAEAVITLQIRPGSAALRYGLVVHTDEQMAGGCEIRMTPAAKTVELLCREADGDARPLAQINNVLGLENPFRIEVVTRGDIVDVCIDHRRTIIARCPSRSGTRLGAYAQDARVGFESIRVHTIADEP